MNEMKSATGSCVRIVMAFAIVVVLAACAHKGTANMASNSEVGGFDLILKVDQDDPDSANWFVNGMIGEKPHLFMLDTGAGSTTVNFDEYTGTFEAVGAKDSAGAFAADRYDVIQVPSLQVGSLSKKDMTISRSAKDSQNRKSVLGMNFLKDFSLHFLFEENRVVAADRKPLPQIEWLDLFMGERFHPYVDLTWEGGTKAKGVWDTGAGMTCFDSGFMKKHPELFKKVGTSIGTDSTGKQVETPVYSMKGFELGGRRFPTTKVVVIDLSVPNSTIKTPMEFILGYDALRRANWIFDFPNRKWGISKMLPQP